MKTKLGFFGCCSTRDIFRTPHNIYYKDEFEILFQLQRGSLISLMQDPVPYTIEATRRIENGQEKVFCSEWVRDDLRKSLFDQIRRGIDYLLLDVYFDTLFGVIIYDDGKIITNNYYDSPYTQFYSDIKDGRIINMLDNHDEFFELWKENCDKFFAYMKKEFPNTKIVLNRLQGATKVVRKDGTSYIAPSYVKKTERFNPALDELQQYIIENHDVRVIDCRELSISYEGHIWGRSFLHYIKDYYNLAYRQMKDILVADKLEKLEELNSKVNYMSEEIKMLSAENQNLLKRNEGKGQNIPSITFDSLKSIQIGKSKVSIPKGYKIHRKGSNGVLLSKDKNFIGIYEVPRGGSFDNKVKEWKRKFDKTETKTYSINNITLNSVTVDNNNVLNKETYFEKNGVKYHIFEKGVEDEIAFKTLFHSVTVNLDLYNTLLNKVKNVPQLSCNSFGYTTKDGKITYHNWRSAFKQRTLLDDFDGYCERIWFTRYLRHKFPDADFNINFFGPFEEHHTLDWPMHGKKVFYSGENLQDFFPEMREKFNTYALDYVDLSMGYDLIDNEKYLRFPFWVWYHFPPTISDEEIENKVDMWNSSNYEKSRDVVSISSHDRYNCRKVIAADVEKTVGITYAGKWRNNTRELWDNFNDNRKEYMKLFKFCVCPENTMANGYVTEKIFDSIISDCIPLYAGGGDYLEPELLNHKAILRWDIGENVDNSDTIELFKNVYSDEKTYKEFKDQDVLLDSSKKYIIKIFYDLEKQFERLIYD